MQAIQSVLTDMAHQLKCDIKQNRPQTQAKHVQTLLSGTDKSAS